MSKNKKTGLARPENKIYLCPQCFTRHYINDVFFVSKRTTGICDMRNAAHRYTFSKREEFLGWCSAGKSSLLLDWRSLPQARRRWNGGIIEAVKDTDGRWIEEKACPCCHVPLPQECPVVFGWSDRGLDCPEARKMLMEAAPGNWKGLMYDGSQPLSYDIIEDAEGRQMFSVPAGIEEAEGSWGEGCRSRLCINADGAVVILRFSRDSLGGIDGSVAERSLSELLDYCGYSGSRLGFPVVVLLEGIEAEDPVKAFRTRAGTARQCLEQCFERTYISPGCGSGSRLLSEALGWLIKEMRRTEE